MNIINKQLTLKISNCLLVPLLLVVGIFTFSQCFAIDRVAAANEITFLTWEEYIDKNVVADFEKQYHAKVNFIYFESDDVRNEMVVNTAAQGYDLIMVDSTYLPFYKKLGWVTPFSAAQAPNIGYTQLPAFAKQNKVTQDCIPYTWGTTGIAYRQDLLAQPITSWKQIFTPSTELHKQVLMPIMGNEVIGIALKSLGYSIASSDSQQLQQAEQRLIAQLPNVAGYAAVAGDPHKSKLISGEVSAIVTYSGDALILKELQPHIKYIVPAEGSAVWIDFICLSAKASNPQLAHQFINFINNPQQAKKNALFVHSATPNSQAEKLLPADFLSDPIIYPSKAELSRLQRYMPLSPSTVIKHDAIMQKLTKMLQ